MTARLLNVEHVAIVAGMAHFMAEAKKNNL
ncbi:hypothetical protein JOE64_002574 [Microbacterium dextranolyticum]|nr:hypothetical protein [Microbacterium dextranolyticum]